MLLGTPRQSGQSLASSGMVEVLESEHRQHVNGGSWLEVVPGPPRLPLTPTGREPEAGPRRRVGFLSDPLKTTLGPSRHPCSVQGPATDDGNNNWQ